MDHSENSVRSQPIQTSTAPAENQRKAWLVGAGIGSLSAAAFMIRDGGMTGSNITILEATPLLGGSLDGAGDPEKGYSLRGGRMLTSDNYECTWDLFRTIPSLTNPAISVHDETMAFNTVYRAHSMARLVDRRRGAGCSSCTERRAIG
ncbi:MAG: oleate hydratase, partial [Pseudomonadota bacterium]